MQKEDLQKILGKHIRKIRENKLLSQNDLANAIGKDQQSIQRIEAGNINPSFYYLFEISRGLGVSLKELLDFEIIEE